MDKMGDAFDYAINDCKIDGTEFVKMFVVSIACKKIENGEESYISGKSGIEIAIECVYETTDKALSVEPSEKFSRSAQYWIGWVVYYYQWLSSRKYADIFKAVSYEDMLGLYQTLQEASVEKIASVIDERIRITYPETNLKRIRTAYSCSQRELAEMSGVSLRSIQMYEQRNKDINKAQSESLYRLSKALGCTMEDLLEK
ncbi:MAG: helix-turn-helix transcriptional regulator [Clostridia bacterium]|nr:helix-turn-helix transcriptional regulator [Clostridia bacterium]